VVAPQAAQQGLTLSTSIAAGTPEALVGDRARTRQVLLNLLANAVKFTPRGEVRIAVSARPRGDGRVEARFAVGDTGIGIAKADLDRLFIPFQQVDGSASRRYGGAGLGLVISKRLTELMGGSIWVESTVGKGSTFHFTVVGEAAASPPPPLPVAPRPAAASPKAFAPLRLLLAEDDRINQLVMLALLEHLGFRADLANNGLEVLAALDQRTYDVILMDVQMPELDGLEATRRIRLQPSPQPYVIALTAHALAGDRERCLAAGMDAYIAKPVLFEDLRAALAAVAPRTARALRAEAVR
jgi:CheY-like chemotaxis protein